MGKLTKEGKLYTEHRHNNTQFSGVFYLQTPEDSGDICFSTPHRITSHWEPSVTGYDDLNSFEKRFRTTKVYFFFLLI